MNWLLRKLGIVRIRDIEQALKTYHTSMGRHRSMNPARADHYGGRQMGADWALIWLQSYREGRMWDAGILGE